VRKKSTETLTGSIPFNRLQPPWGLEPDPGKCEEKLFLKAVLKMLKILKIAKIARLIQERSADTLYTLSAR
jgi:hypothetical protein